MKGVCTKKVRNENSLRHFAKFEDVVWWVFNMLTGWFVFQLNRVDFRLFLFLQTVYFSNFTPSPPGFSFG